MNLLYQEHQNTIHRKVGEKGGGKFHSGYEWKFFREKVLRYILFNYV